MLPCCCAQVVKELRTEYSSAVASTCQRMSAALSANPATSIYTLLNQAKVASAQAGPNMTPMQQHAMIESLSHGMFACLNEVLCNLAAALDSRVFVATGRGLWDFIGRDLLGFVENLQVGRAACHASGQRFHVQMTAMSVGCAGCSGTS